jgi:hypothetical protein
VHDRIVHHADVLTLKGSNHDHVAYVSTVVNTRARMRRHRGRIGCQRGNGYR